MAIALRRISIVDACSIAIANSSVVSDPAWVHGTVESVTELGTVDAAHSSVGIDDTHPPIAGVPGHIAIEGLAEAAVVAGIALARPERHARRRVPADYATSRATTERGIFARGGGTTHVVIAIQPEKALTTDAMGLGLPDFGGGVEARPTVMAVACRMASEALAELALEVVPAATDVPITIGDALTPSVTEQPLRVSKGVNIVLIRSGIAITVLALVPTEADVALTMVFNATTTTIAIRRFSIGVRSAVLMVVMG